MPRLLVTAVGSLLLAGSLSLARPHLSQEKRIMNVKRITPVLLVNEIEPLLPFSTERLGFAKTIEVPDGNQLGFVIFQKGSAEVMYQRPMRA